MNENLKILMFGDIVGETGREAIKKILPQWKKEMDPDLIIANAENLAHGKGITKKTAEEMIRAGINVFTSGNHIWAKKEGIDLLQDPSFPLIRPANYPEEVPGQTFWIQQVRTHKILIFNLMGRVFFPEMYECPFRYADKILKKFAHEKLSAIIVDIHAEATSEKQALAWYLDGRVSAILGTHTHVPTADVKILTLGTGYITDIGMTGASNSVLGIKKEIVIERFLKQTPMRFEIAEGEKEINAVLLEIDPQNKKTVKIKLVQNKIA